VLSETDLAQHYLNSKGSIDYLPNSAAGLVADVPRWLTLNGLDHRLDEQARIASEAFRIVQQVREQQAPSQAQANQYDVRQGHGDRRTDLDEVAMRQADEIALINTIKNTSMADWGQARINLGIAPKSSLDHLAGSFGN
jgi:hypothetical protein